MTATFQRATTNLRKAALLVRSLDAETAAVLLAQLSLEEAQAVRAAIRLLGPVDPEERADLAAEFRRISPLAAEDPRDGVELRLAAATAAGRDKRFEFLDRATTKSLVPYLAREHGQTVAVVLSYLAPQRAADVLAALPARLQADTIERLSALGDTDSDSLQVIEQELAAWVASQQARRHRARGSDAVAAILAAADEHARDGIMVNLQKHNRRLAEELSPAVARKSPAKEGVPQVCVDLARSEGNRRPTTRRDTCWPAGAPPAASPAATSWFHFDDLAHVERSTLAAVLNEVDSQVMVLALAASSDELVERVAGQMPRRMAKSFRRKLRQLGPTRLRDVEGAQRAVAAAAAQVLDAQNVRTIRTTA